MAKRKVDLDPKHRPDYVAYGSEAHKALLGLVDGTIFAEGEQEKREAALAAKPKPGCKPEKVMIGRNTYEPYEEIMDGWFRKSS